MHFASVLLFLGSILTTHATLKSEKDQIPPRDRGCLRLLTDQPTPELAERWDKLLRLIDQQPRAEHFRRAMLIAIQQTAYDGLQFGRFNEASGYKFETWFTDVNSAVHGTDRLNELDLRQLLNHMQRYEIVRFSIPQGRLSTGRPTLVVTRDVYAHLDKNEAAQRAARVNRAELRELWNEIHNRSGKFPRDAALRAGAHLWWIDADGNLRILFGQASISL